jgi:hypothetical protein
MASKRGINDSNDVIAALLLSRQLWSDGEPPKDCEDG